MNRHLALAGLALALLACGRSFTAPKQIAVADVYALAVDEGTDNQSGVVGSAVALPLRVTLTLNGAPAANAQVVFAVSGGGGSLSPATATTDASGVATSQLTLGRNPGTNSVTVTGPGGATASFTALGLVDASSETSLIATQGDGTQAPVGSSIQLEVKALDRFQNPVPDAGVGFEVESGDAELAASSATTQADGKASTTLNLGGTAGPVRVLATWGANTLVFSLQALPGALKSLRVTSGDGQFVAVDQALAPIVVTAFDGDQGTGNPVPNVTITASATDPLAVILDAPTSIATGADGKATFAAHAGMFSTGSSVTSIDFTAGDAGDQSATVTVLPGIPDSMVALVDGGAATVLAGVVGERTSDIAVQVFDKYQNPVPGIFISFFASTGSVAPLATTDSNGVASSSWLLGTRSGPQHVFASAGGTSLQVGFDAIASPGPVASLEKSVGDLSVAEVCTPVALGAVAKDAYANPVPGVPVTFSINPQILTRCPGYLPDAGQLIALTLDDGGAALGSLQLGSVAGGQGPRASASGAADVTYTVQALPAAPSLIVSLGSQVAQATVGQLVSGDDAKVAAYDAYSNLALGHPLHLEVLQGGGAVADADPYPDGRGYVDVGWTLGTVAGFNALQVTSLESDAGAVTLRALAEPDVPAAIVAASPAVQTVPKNGTATASVRIIDQYGNGVSPTAASVTWEVGSPFPAGPFTPPTGLDDLGYASTSSSAFTGGPPSFTVTATANGDLGPVPGSVTFQIDVDGGAGMTVTPPGAMVGDPAAVLHVHLEAYQANVTFELDGQSRQVVSTYGGTEYWVALTAADTAQAGLHTLEALVSNSQYASATVAMVAGRAPYGPPPMVTSYNTYGNAPNSSCAPGDGVDVVAASDGGIAAVVSGETLFFSPFAPSGPVPLCIGDGTYGAYPQSLAYDDTAGPTGLLFGATAPGFTPQFMDVNGGGLFTTHVQAPIAAARMNAVGSGLHLLFAGPYIDSVGGAPNLCGGSGEIPTTTFAIDFALVSGSPDAGAPAIFCGEDAPAVSVAVQGDFDGDGVADAVFFGPDNYRFVRGHATTYPNIDVSAPVSLAGMSLALGATAGHFTGSPHLDIALADDQGGLRILQGNGDGTFTDLGAQAALATFYASAHGPALKAIRFPGDSRDGLVMAIPASTSGESGEVRSYRSTGTGFALVDVLPFDHYANLDLNAATPVSFPRDLAVADVNGDGYPDVLLGGRSPEYENGKVQDSRVQVILGGDGGSLMGTVEVSNGAYDGRAPTFVDLDGDGKLDAVIGMQDRVTTHLNLGRGRFGPEQDTFISGGTPSVFAVGDFTGDGKPDVVVSGSTALAVVLPGLGDGTFGSGTASQGALLQSQKCSATRLLAADLDGDGKLDVLASVTCIDPATGAATLLAVSLRGDGAGGLAVVHWEIAPFEVQALADLDDDGVPDLLASPDAAPALIAAFGRRDASGGITFAAPEVLAERPLSTPASVTTFSTDQVVDFDRDGKTDILVGDQVFLRGAGHAYTARTLPMSGLAVGDLNGDGVPDLLVGKDNGAGAMPVGVLFLDPTWTGGAIQWLPVAGDIQLFKLSDAAVVPLGGGAGSDFAVVLSPFGEGSAAAAGSKGESSFYTVLDAP